MSAPGGGVVDGLLRVLGGLVGLVGGFVAGLLAVLLVPLRVGDAGELVSWYGGLADTAIGSVRVPVAVVVAVGANLVLIRFTERATGVRWGVLLPGLGWFVMVVATLQTTAERDRLLLPDDWVAVLTLFAGTTVVVIGTVLALISPDPGRAGAARPASAPAPRTAITIPAVPPREDGTPHRPVG
ncbi:MAG: hypothetical protein GEV12_21445 [Micromonosporaceae bacterium]|nr:hypothetical protein [Micromonosporaceae bacterium]